MHRVVRRLFALAYRTIWNTLRVRFAHNQRNRYFKFRSSGTPAGVPLLLFSQVGSLQRHFLRKRSAAGIPGHHFTKQKSHRFCISASTMASYWSGRRGSNSLPPPWQGGALPDELRPHTDNAFFALSGPPQRFAKQRFVGRRRKSGIHHRSLACKTSR